MNLDQWLEDQYNWQCGLTPEGIYHDDMPVEKDDD